MGWENRALCAGEGVSLSGRIRKGESQQLPDGVGARGLAAGERRELRVPV